MGVPNAKYYTEGRYGKRIRETLDTENKYLYSMGKYATKITKDMLPEWYIPIHSRSIWYLNGYVNVKNIDDVYYTYVKENHLFKDDYIYLKLYGKLNISQRTNSSYIDVENYDMCIDGIDILRVLFAIEKYNPKLDTSLVRKKIEEKIEYLRLHEQSYYENCFNTKSKIDIFKLAKEGEWW